MNKTVDMFREETWCAYVSSALTIPDKIQRENVKSLNLKIKSWLKSVKVFGYLPQEYSDPSLNDLMSPEEVYILDRWRIAECDFVIMNLDRASFGVGQEAEIATSIGIPIIPFHYYKNQVSRIIRGVPGIFIKDRDQSPENSIILYHDLDTFEDLQEKLISRVKLILSYLDSMIKGNNNLLPPFSERLSKAMNNCGETDESLANKAGLSIPFIKALKHDYKSVKKILEPYKIFDKYDLKNISINKYLNPGLWILQRLSKALNLRISDLIGEEIFEFEWLEPLMIAAKKGLNFEKFLDVIPLTDYKIYYTNAARFENTRKAKETIADELLAICNKQNDRKKE